VDSKAIQAVRRSTAFWPGQYKCFAY